MPDYSLNQATQQEIVRVGEILRNRDPLYQVDFHKIINRRSSVHPSDYVKLYNAVARIIVECAQRLSAVPLHPEMAARTYLHWLTVMLNAPLDAFTLGDVDDDNYIVANNLVDKLPRTHEPVRRLRGHLDDGESGPAT
jgi:hypothetical protein